MLNYAQIFLGILILVSGGWLFTSCWHFETMILAPVAAKCCLQNTGFDAKEKYYASSYSF